MKTIDQSNRSRWWTVVVFALAMAWVESAVVFYLRTMIDRVEPYQLEPLPHFGLLGPVELGREVATMIMLFVVGQLAGRTWRSRFGYSALAFGVWDISYYLFLKVMCGWPDSLLDWDILFLLPLPWWGPVLAPVLIALLMIVWGTLASQLGPVRTTLRSRALAWGIAVIGMAVALWLFMYDSLQVIDQGVESIRNVLPVQFNWPLFTMSLVLMACPVIEICRAQLRRVRVGRSIPVRAEQPSTERSTVV